MRRPDHGRDVKSFRRRIKHDFVASFAVIGDDIASPGYTNEELVETAVGVLAADAFIFDSVDEEIALHFERHLAEAFAEDEAAAQVFDVWKTVDEGFTDRPDSLVLTGFDDCG